MSSYWSDARIVEECAAAALGVSLEGDRFVIDRGSLLDAITAQRESAESAARRMLAEFHDHPNALGEGTNTQALRRTLHQEEHDELMHELQMAAEGTPDLGQIARELADVLYVTYGTAWAFGIDLDAALAEVHRAAMDKMNAGLRRDDGKILKPPGFVPPDMTAAVNPAGPESSAGRGSGTGASDSLPDASSRASTTLPAPFPSADWMPVDDPPTSAEQAAANTMRASDA